MSLRFVAGAALLGSFAFVKGFMPAPAAQAPEKQPEKRLTARWEYKALKLEANQCQFENQVAQSLNVAGEEGWELVGYERMAAIYPQSADGSLLIRPAATGPGREHTPQTADSFEGTISMKMAQVKPGSCRLLFKRQALAAAK